jgi:hypothetical protein
MGTRGARRDKKIQLSMTKDKKVQLMMRMRGDNTLTLTLFPGARPVSHAEYIFRTPLSGVAVLIPRNVEI